ncbi:PREDICTED: geraniol 8-hydroxylase-like [Nicotiana attenuata]|uniref:geraniol 8-hydroxylase-like n=1 Tax=Nicotiana attenuata TaxID=49451 RepID=UPI00090549A4|nr:PREDICTED: geraniol 8-hydroxylase-like [Nicotiana attenuata]
MTFSYREGRIEIQRVTRLAMASNWAKEDNLFLNATSRRVKKRLPPGPFPLPIIGNVHLLTDQPHKSLARLAKIMYLKLGQKNTLVISSSILAKQVLQKQDLAFCNRSIPNAVRALNHSDFSSVFLPSRWRTLRKIMNSNIFSRNKLDSNHFLRSRKVQELIDYCYKCSQDCESVDIDKETFKLTLCWSSSIICWKFIHRCTDLQYIMLELSMLQQNSGYFLMILQALIIFE